ncbi:MAG: hypothetical protein ACLTAI_05570 [Thomasclavelia sp.]
MNIPPIVIGLTVVAFGTSAPEAAISIISGMNGDADLAIGNIIGSNIINVLANTWDFWMCRMFESEL